jgi:hypothetical protein
MPRFVTAHITSCMTRQDLDKLVKRFMSESTQGVKNIRTYCDTMAGRMVCEWEAPDQATLVDWLKKRNVRFRGEDEWIMLVQMEAVDGQMTA